MEENKVWIVEGLLIAFLIIQTLIPLFYYNYFSLRECAPELASRSNLYLFIFTVSGIIVFSSALYLKREKTLILELLVFIVGIMVILSEAICV